MHVLVDVIDPRYRNEMMVLSIRRALLGELDLVGSVEMVDFADRLPVRRNHVHVFLDLRDIGHVSIPRLNERLKRVIMRKVASPLRGVSLPVGGLPYGKARLRAYEAKDRHNATAARKTHLPRPQWC
jgi:hypothetical protein